MSRGIWLRLTSILCDARATLKRNGWHAEMDNSGNKELHAPWQRGVPTSPDADNLPSGPLRRGENSPLISSGLGVPPRMESPSNIPPTNRSEWPGAVPQTPRQIQTPWPPNPNSERTSPLSPPAYGPQQMGPRSGYQQDQWAPGAIPFSQTDAENGAARYPTSADLPWEPGDDESFDEPIDRAQPQGIGQWWFAFAAPGPRGNDRWEVTPDASDRYRRGKLLS